MSFRMPVSFLVGAAFFTVLPIYAPFVVLQTEEVPRFLLGLGAGVVAGAVLALINGAARGLLLVLACASVGASLYTIVYAIPTFSGGEEWLSLAPALLLFALAYSVLPAAVGWALAVLASSLRARRGRAVHRSPQVPAPEAGTSVPPPLRRPPTAAAAGEGELAASPSRRRRRKLALLLLIGAIVIAGIVGFVGTLVINLEITGGTVADNIGFSVAAALSGVISGAIIAALVMLLGGGAIYLLDRDRRGSANTRIAFLRAALSWQVLVVAAGLVLLMSLSQVASMLTVQV